MIGQETTMVSNWSPLVSIVTPSLNAEKYIEQAIISVRSQQYANVEHIIVDGKSGDGTVSIIRRHEAEYNLRWVSERDESPDQAVNKGIGMAGGEVIGLLGADDIYLPWTVRTVVEGFRGSPSADLIYGDLVEAPFGQRYGKIYFNPSPTHLPLHLHFNSIASMAVFFRKSVFGTLGGFDERLQITGDYDFWLRAARRFNWSKVDEVLGCFRYRRSSKSIGDRPAHTKEKALMRLRYPDQTSRVPSLEQARYYFGRVARTSGNMLGLLEGSSPVKGRTALWGNLRSSGSVSRMRLMVELLLSPLLSTNNAFERAIRHGSVDVSRLARLATS